MKTPEKICRDHCQAHSLSFSIPHHTPLRALALPAVFLLFSLQVCRTRLLASSFWQITSPSFQWSASTCPLHPRAPGLTSYSDLHRRHKYPAPLSLAIVVSAFLFADVAINLAFNFIWPGSSQHQPNNHTLESHKRNSWLFA